MAARATDIVGALQPPAADAGGDCRGRDLDEPAVRAPGDRRYGLAIGLNLAIVLIEVVAVGDGVRRYRAVLETIAGCSLVDGTAVPSPGAACRLARIEGRAAHGPTAGAL